MPAETQTRLLRVLADGEFYRVGGHEALRTDVRIIAATHQDLEELVRRGDFREDLFHRLNVIRIHLPRSRSAARTSRLMRISSQQAAQELGGEPKVLLPETEQFLMSLDWPGNVRQLENTCRWLTVMASGREIHSPTCRRSWAGAAPRSAPMTRTTGDAAGAMGAQRAGQRQAAHPARGDAGDSSAA
jgi:two-component system nitrogen regulation response regulator GlnG